MEDLFRSRFTHFAKLKIVVDPSSQPLETGLVKKIAFVELNSFADQNRVLKWQDLFYKGSRRVVIEMANFMDFKNTMEFNQKHADELASAEQGFLSHRPKPQVMGRRTSVEPLARHEFHRGPPSLHHAAPATNGDSTPVLGTPVLGARVQGAPVKGTPVLAKPAAPKPNPFGNAKPVDVNARLHEIEKQLITINHTTIRTAGTPDKKKVRKLKDRRGSSEKEERETNHIQSKVEGLEAHKESHSEVSPEEAHEKCASKVGADSQDEMKPTQPPPSIYDLKHSLADLLSAKPEDNPLVRSASGTPKPKASKPVILKKPPSVVSSPAHQLELERSHTPSDELKPEVTTPTSGANSSPQKIHTPENKEIKEKLDKTRKRRELKSKDPAQTRDDKEKLSPHSIMERNKSFSSEDHPNFKEHLNEMTQDKLLPRSSRSGSRRSRLSRDRRRGKRAEGDQLRDMPPEARAGEMLPEKSQDEPSLEKPLGDKPHSAYPNVDVKKRAPRRHRGGASKPKRTEGDSDGDGREIRGTNGEDSKTEDGRSRRGGRNRGRGRRRNPGPESSKPQAENGSQ